jgi:hypothetical protein
VLDDLGAPVEGVPLYMGDLFEGWEGLIWEVVLFVVDLFLLLPLWDLFERLACLQLARLLEPL